MERRLSRLTGALLLLMIFQGALGYALLGPGADDAWVRWTHRVDVVVLVFLAVWMVPTTRGLPSSGTRTAVLRQGTAALLSLLAVQLFFGLLSATSLPTRFDIVTWHVGIGLLTSILVVGLHITAITPSLLLAAQREREKSLRARGP